MIDFYLDKVPKLVIDESTMEMLASKLSEFPIHAGPDGGLLEPGILDLVDDTTAGQWQPGDQRTKLVVLGGEACREIVFCSERFKDPSAQKRTLKNLTVPVCSLMDVVVALQASLNDRESRETRLAWPSTDQNNYLEAGRRLRKTHYQGPVRKVRHKLGAHLDPKVFDEVDVRLKPEQVLAALGDALVVFMLALNHRARAFSWIRPAGSSKDGSRLVVETMFDYPACVRWETDSDGRVLDVSAVVLAADPRHEVQDRIFAGIEAYNFLVRSSGARLPQMWANTKDLAEVLSDAPKSGDPRKPMEILLAKGTPDSES